MSEAQGELVVIDMKREMPAQHPEKSDVQHNKFAVASTNDLISLKKAAVVVKEECELYDDHQKAEQAESVYKNTSLELFFRIYGDAYRREYNKWLVLKKKKEQDWELQMYAKYGPQWRGQITESDRELLVYTSSDLEAYEKHKQIEENALQLQEKDSNKLQEKEKEASGRESKGDFFKVVKARTLTDFPFLNEREVHKAVYSIDFLFFYMRLLTRMTVKKGVRQLRGKEFPEGMEFEQKMNQSAIYVKELALFNRMRPKSTLSRLLQAA